ncbi:serine hydrolase [Streptomyces sp. R21]|uniref:Serine hydrolase n=1 Tax=Streptomyces sp. R21 TaxID=3238627 RepID=A0AB39PFQ5_9ACTN
MAPVSRVDRVERVEVDRATAVFSTRAVAAAQGKGSGPDSGSDEGEGSGSGSGSGSEGSPEAEAGGKSAEGDARLRAAVAAWVAVADSEEPEKADSETGSGDDGDDAEAADEAVNADADADVTDVQAADEVTPDAEPADAPKAVAEEPAAADTEPDAPDSDEASDEGPEDAASPEDAAPKPAADAEATDEPKAEAADAGDDKTPEDATPHPAADRPTAVFQTLKPPVADKPDADAAEEPKAAAVASADADAEGDKAKPADRPAAKPVADRSTAVFQAVKPPVADKPVADADPADKPKADADADAAAPDDAKPVADRPTADLKADEPPVSDEPADAEPDAKDAKSDKSDKAPEDAAPADKPKADADSDDDADDSAAPKPAVDQPTAVFKAMRPPAVDQPTTMLKLGDVKPPADKAKSADKPKPTQPPKPTPERDAERTSKFVALKPLDEPAPTKPKAASEGGTPSVTATTAMPQVGPERTTQQPLPPKPPLDLLAELTNTPPPRQTPVRTIVRRVKIWTPLVILLAVIFAVAQAVRPLPAPSLALTADETYTFEGGNLGLPWPGQGQSAIEVEGVGSLGTDGKQTPMPIASVAKIMTAYVILQEHPLKGNENGEQITVDQQAEDESKNEDESTAAITKGQKFTERQVLQMLMIPSGNNAARLLARWDSDSDTFVGKMNAAAKKLGMTKTTYTDPSGLDKTTVSTATDQLKLAKSAMQDKVFRGIVGMASAQIPGLDKPIYTTNDLLTTQVGVIGLKTGSSTPAGGNLVWAATKTVDGEEQTIYGAVLNQNAGTGRVWDSLKLSLTNSQKLINKIQQSLTSATVVKKGDVVGYVDDGLGGRTPVVATKNMKAVGWPGLKTSISIGAGEETVPHSAKAGTVVGELTVGDGSNHAVKIPVALKSDLTEPGYGAKLTRVS